MAGLKEILECLHKNVLELKWEHEFSNSSSIGIFTTYVKINRKKYFIWIGGELFGNRDRIYISSKKRGFLSFFSGQDKSGIFNIYKYAEQQKNVWPIANSIFTKLVFKHTKELSFFLADKEAYVHKNVINTIREIEDKD